MGWQEGRGLGARGDGMLTHVTVAKKDNQLGTVKYMNCCFLPFTDIRNPQISKNAFAYSRCFL
jgi:hypothetical protein